MNVTDTVSANDYYGVDELATPSSQGNEYRTLSDVRVMEPPNTNPHQYAWDLALVFPRLEDFDGYDENKYSMDKFVNLMLGLRKKGGIGESRNEYIQDKLRVVLRTERCFLNDVGLTCVSRIRTDEMAEALADMNTSKAFLDSCKAALSSEYERYIGNCNPTTPTIFSELVASSITRRIQIACGLSTHLYRGYNDRSIILLIRADDMDLRVEAERINYPLQTSLRPFHPMHKERNEMLEKQLGEESFQESVDHLRRTRGSAYDDGMPELDPILTAKGDEFQPKLYRALEDWGHSELADAPDCTARDDPESKMGHYRQFINSLFYVSIDKYTYFSPYVEYKMDKKYQPYYRWYPLDPVAGRSEETLFLQIDRIRLATSIIERHVGVDALMNRKYLNAFFPLHDRNILEHLKKNWAMNFTMTKQPIFELRNYFDEKIALYFCWLEFYTKKLVIPAIIGTIIFIISLTHDTSNPRAPDGSELTDGNDGYYLIFYSLLIVIWSTLFTELWRRKNCVYNTLWGMDQKDNLSTSLPRAQFLGEQRWNPVTDQTEMWYIDTKKRTRKLIVSFLVVLIMIGIVIIALGGLFYFKDNLQTTTTDEANLAYYSYAISLLNAIQILLLNIIYRYVAIMLNDWENHRTDIEYQNYLIIKVFLFQFVNSFISFFYIAFLRTFFEDDCVNNDCFGELQSQLAILFVVRIVVGNAIEVGLPMLQLKYQRSQTLKAAAEASPTGEPGTYGFQPEELQAKLAPYQDMESFDDYSEMVIQFGFITLFVVAFPLTPFLAFLNNVLELHVDAYKICTFHRRPFPQKARNYGAWFYFLQVMSNIAIITNVALLLFTSDLFNQNYSKATKFIVFLLAEHIALGAKAIVEKLVNEIPLNLQLLNERYQFIEDVVFKGYQLDTDDERLREQAERVNVVIQPHPAWTSTEYVA